MEIENKLPGIKKNVLLKNYTTFRIGGKAKYFFLAKTKKDLVLAVRVAKKLKLPFFILGGGSNLLVSDKGFNGLIIKNESKNLKIKKERIIAESGATLNKIIDTAIKKGLAGIEKGSGIPGTIGGAVYGNAGWPRGAWAIGNLVEKVEILWPNGKIEKVGKKWLSFDYRHSHFKEIKINKPVILEVILKLKKGKIKDLEKRRQEIFKIRGGKIPSGFSAGSVFKNFTPYRNEVSGAGPALKMALKKFKEKDSIPAAYLIEKCGLKGKKIGNVKISEKHANFIINLGNGKAKDVKKLINLAKNKVKNKFKTNLEEEIQIF